ncbi:DUF6177 family protein [Actinomadura rifamycini]|uniref:DUF6177 family protein n=1 Tax=Actinomadura rifamycini TaxID=31962 RepID=UPI000400835B|nr:DUF6177 family protein [Actinomadura rifamycini]
MTVHPAVDTRTDAAVVVVQNRPLVPLSSWLLDAIATTDRPAFHLLTPHDSRITPPLRTALDGTGARWVVQEPGDAGYYDGLTGEPLDWDGSMFAPVPGAPPAAYEAHERTDGHHLVLTVSVVHRATAALELGRTAETIGETLAGTAPRCWGTSEPALRAWDRAMLTDLCRRRAPRGTFLVVAGPGRAFVGTQRVTRAAGGVKETLTFVVGGAGPEPPVGPLVRLADGLAADGVLHALTAHWTDGRADLTHAPHRPRALELLGLAIGERAGDGRGRPIGTDDHPGTWFGADGRG